MLDTAFREYDIRGKIGSEFPIESAYDLAAAIAYYVRQHNPSAKTFAIGMDGRTHSPAIKDEVCRALADAGFDVLFIGLCTSPVLYFVMNTQPVDAGIMITASHNPKEYNGLKLCLGKQFLWGKQVQEIRELLRAGKVVTSDQKGAVRDHPAIPTYIEWFANHFKDLIGMKMSVVMDCGNGAAGAVMPELIARMQWPNIQLLCAEVDGNYPNHEADPVRPENMEDTKQRLMTTDAVVGIGFDGDADRMAPMTKSGYLVPGDQLLALFAKKVLEEHPGASLVTDIKCSAGVLNMLTKLGGKPHLSPSGHAIMKEQMQKHHALLGGELSCHFFFHDKFFGYDDGIYAAFRLLELLNNTSQTLDEMIAEFPTMYSSPEILIACDESKKKAVINHVRGTFAKRDDVSMITIDGVRASMPYGWGIIRSSNTRPKLTIRFESDTPQGLQRVKDDFVAAMEPYFPAQHLKEQFNEHTS